MHFKKLFLPFLVCLLMSFLFSKPTFAQWNKGGSYKWGKKKADKVVKYKKREAKLADVSWDRKTQGQLRIFVNPKARLFLDGEIQRDPKGKIRASAKFAVALEAGKRSILMDMEGLKTVTCVFVDSDKKKHTIPIGEDGGVILDIVAGKAHSVNFTLAKLHHTKGAMVLVPVGDFVMGLSAKSKKKSDLEYIVERIGGDKNFHNNEVPRHKVFVEAFKIDQYEVSNVEYQKFAQETGRSVLPDDWENNSYPPGQGDHPVTYVTWEDADAFCKWAGKRLPTEEEWEKAARWETDRKKPIAYFFPWGDSFRRGKANTASGGPGKTMPIGSYEDGKSPYGAYDMAGNVKEWTSNWYKDYPGNPLKDEFSDGEQVKVARGGSWRDKKYDVLGSCRLKYSLTHADDDLGFRCARDVDKKK